MVEGRIVGLSRTSSDSSIHLCFLLHLLGFLLVSFLPGVQSLL